MQSFRITIQSLGVVGLVLTCLTIHADESRRLTLDECVRLGIARSVDLQNAARDEQIAAARIRQARAQALPSLDASASYTRLDEVTSIPDTSISLGRLDNYSAGFDASQLLYAGGSVSAALDAAQDFRDVTTHAFSATRNALVRQVTVAFHGILFARTRLGVTRQSVAQLESFVSEARSKYENGLISDFDMLSAEVKLANERPKLVKDRNSLELDRAAFAKLLKLEDDKFELEGSLDCVLRSFDLDELIGLGLRERPDLRASRARIRLRESDVKIKKGNLYPELSARGSYRGDNPDQRSFSGADDWGWHWEAGLDLSWSLLDGGLRRAELMEKRLEQEKTESESRDLERQIVLEIKQSYLTLEDAREVVESSQKAVDLAQKAFDIAGTRYSQGLSTYLEFTDSNLALSQAKLNRALSMTRYLQALADLRYACGVEMLPQEGGGEK